MHKNVLNMSKNNGGKSRIRETLTLLMCADNSIVSKNKSKDFGPIWNASLFLRLYTWTFHELNTFHAWMIHKYNLEQLLYF